MPESSDPNLASTLSKRFDDYGKMVEDIVLRGLEHPAIELKRTGSYLFAVGVQLAALRRCLRHLSLKHLRQIIALPDFWRG
jgi:hypothetical protein